MRNKFILRAQCQWIFNGIPIFIESYHTTHDYIQSFVLWQFSISVVIAKPEKVKSRVCCLINHVPLDIILSIFAFSFYRKQFATDSAHHIMWCFANVIHFCEIIVFFWEEPDVIICCQDILFFKYICRPLRQYC